MHEISLKPSRLLGWLQAAMAALALGAVWLAALPWAAQLALSLGVVWLGVRSRRTPAALRLRADGSLQWRDAAGDWQDTEVLADSWVSRWAMVARLRVATQVIALTLLPDSAPADDLRRLRVALRWTRRTRSDTASPDAG